MSVPRIGNYSYGPGPNRPLKYVFDTGVSIVVALEDLATVHLVPADAVISVGYFVASHPLVSVLPTLSYHTYELPLNSAGNLNPLISVVLEGCPAVVYHIQSRHFELPTRVYRRVCHRITKPHGITNLVRTIME